MLACHPRRQHLHHFQPPPPIDIPTTSSPHVVFDNSLFSNCNNPLDEKLLQSYLTSIAPPCNNSFTGHETPDVDQYMTNQLHLQQPDIRIQQSTPQPQLPLPYAPSPNSIDSAISLDSCYSFSGPDTPMSGGTTLQTPTFTQRSRSHQRFPSSSSVASSAPASPHHGLAPPMQSYHNTDHASPGPTSLKFESSHDADESSRFSNHLPTPSDTPIQDSFAAPQYQNFNFGNNMDMAAAMVYNNGIMMDHHQNTEDDVPAFSHSSRHSVSSYGHDSPATPHTAPGDDFDERFKVPQTEVRQNVPKFDRTVSDAYQDELYQPNNMAAMPVSVAPKPRINTNLLSPFRSSVNERLQAAQNARSLSPASVTSGGVSPFRHGSPFAQPSNSFGAPLGFQPTAQPHERANVEPQYHGLKQQQQQQQQQPQTTEPKTISPKEAMLDYQPTAEDAKMPLFPDDSSADGYSQYDDASYQAATQSGYNDASDQKFTNIATPSDHSWNTPTSSGATAYNNTPTSAPSQPSFNFVPPQAHRPMQGMHYQESDYLSTNGMTMPEDTPEFPAHLTSMESSVSEAPPASSQNSNGHNEITRPTSTLADSGTYTCTYHGCNVRFETPQKLQKHKREGHRQNPTPTSPGVGSGMTSAALLARNSQAGPHKCERVNPTTGKPCNVIFSRPYDLTRHEDTIHNARKQKVRCALCVEEKTFSRNDALTRHMRVVHPEVDFPGKHRRRGAHD